MMRKQEARMRYVRLLTAAFIGTALLAPAAQAQPYPAKPVRVINPFPPGGPADSLIRPVTQKMGEGLKQQLIFDSRPGANGAIGTVLAIKSPPDGYTLLVGTGSSLTMHAAVNPKLPFDPIRDLAPISAVAFANQVLVVHPSLPATNLKQFVALARARPGQMVYASTGFGGAPHFAAEMLASQTGVKLLHVPYKGGAPATVDLLAGHVMMYFGALQSAIEHIRSGRVRALGLATLKRTQAAPDIPTISESGVPNFEVGNVYGLFAPASTPRDIVGRLHAEIVRVMALPEIRNPIIAAGSDPVANSPEEFAASLRADMVKWAKVAREANIRAE
jgi:tripartite-type tricarboxylate transporter receptor subunit TctC